MRVRGLDGREYPWRLEGRQPFADDTIPRSALHKRARALIRLLYPTERVLEEVPLPGSRDLVADFYLPLRKLVVEANGEQHYRFIQHFHKDRAGWLRSQKHDKDKAEWCAINGIKLASLPFDKDDNEWKQLILSV
jgi:hypothetical protein